MPSPSKSRTATDLPAPAATRKFTGTPKELVAILPGLQKFWKTETVPFVAPEETETTISNLPSPSKSAVVNQLVIPLLLVPTGKSTRGANELEFKTPLALM